MMMISHIPAGRIAHGSSVAWHHPGRFGPTLIEGTVTGFYGGSGRYAVATERGERTPLAGVLERSNPHAPRAA